LLQPIVCSLFSEDGLFFLCMNIVFFSCPLFVVPLTFRSGVVSLKLFSLPCFGRPSFPCPLCLFLAAIRFRHGMDMLASFFVLFLFFFWLLLVIAHFFFGQFSSPFPPPPRERPFCPLTCPHKRAFGISRCIFFFFPLFPVLFSRPVFFTLSAQ